MKFADAARGPLAAASAEAAARELPALKRQLHEEGYCCIPEFLAVDQVDALRSETRDYPGRLKGSPPSEAFSVDWDGADRIRQIYHAEMLSPLLNAVIRSDRTLGVLRRVFGYDIALYSSTRTVFDRIGDLLMPGTVIIFDEFYHYFGWEEHEAKAFLEFVVAEKVEIEYLARTPTCQVSLRVLGRGVAPRSSVRHCTWSPTGAGVGIRNPNKPEAEGSE